MGKMTIDAVYKKVMGGLNKTIEQNCKEYVQMHEHVSGAKGEDKDIEFLKKLLGIKKSRKRKHGENVQSNAERQKRFRERRKAEGRARKESWDEPNPDPGYEYVRVNVHQSSFGSCKNILWDFLGILEQLREKVGRGNFPNDVYQDIIEFLSVLGFDEKEHRKRIETVNEMIKKNGKESKGLPVM
jgi:hypothetical protein